MHGDAIKIRVAAPPVGGAANAELIAFVSKTLGVPKSDVSIVSGTTGRRKTIVVKGWSDEELRAHLSTSR
jgi:hypothetical protein